MAPGAHIPKKKKRITQVFALSLPLARIRAWISQGLSSRERTGVTDWSVLENTYQRFDGLDGHPVAKNVTSSWFLLEA